MTGSRFSREAFVTDLQTKLAEAAKEKADTEAQLRQVRAYGCWESTARRPLLQLCCAPAAVRTLMH